MSNTRESRRVIIELGPSTLLALLQIPLICLKLVNLIVYPWWIVLIPWWSMFAIGIIVTIIHGIMWVVKNTFYFSKK